MRRPLLPLILIAVAAIALIAFLVNRDGSEASSPPGESPVPVADERVDAPPVAAVRPQPAAPRERVADAPPRPADPGGAYASEAFSQVPDWIPLHPEAITAVARDASLRSDGFREGRLSFTFPEGIDPLPKIREHLETAGLTGEGDRFHLEEPERTVVLRRVAVREKTRVRLDYSGFDHTGDCGCPTCSGETGTE